MSTIAEIQETNIDVKNRLIYINSEDYYEDGQETGVDFKMASQFIKNMNYLIIKDNKKPIHIHMNSKGGDWNYGMAMYSTILNCPCHVTITAYAWARSMSSIILQAANERILMPYTDFMVHWGTDAVDGHYLAVKSTVEFNAKVEKTMLNIYANKCLNGNYFKQNNMKIDDVSNFIEDKILKKSDWWMTAAEAVDYGFADKIA